MNIISNLRNKYRSLQPDQNNALIAGICAGVANWLNTDKMLVRAAFILLAVFSGFGIVLYLILFFLMSDEVKSFLIK